MSKKRAKENNYKSRGRAGRWKKVRSKQWKSLAKLLGIVPIPGSPTMTKSFRQLLKKAPKYIINDEVGKWKWQVPINELDEEVSTEG